MAYPVIGHVEGRLAADHDTIAVTGPHDNFRRSKFKVTDAAVYLKELLVIYDNGAPDRIPVREDIPKGGESRVIDLRGAGTRSLRKIEFWYDIKGVFRARQT
jgi:hypothetical protein